MKKTTKILSTAMATLMLVSAVPATSASAATVKVAKPKVTVANVSKGVKISWKKAKNAKKYVIMRKLSTAKKYKAIKTVKKSKAGSYVDKTAKAGKKYKYTVKAVNGKKSATSAVQTVVRLKAPNLENLTAKKGYGYFKWGEVTGAKKYEVYVAEVINGKTGKYKLAQNSKRKDYYEYCYTNNVVKYKVRAVNGKSKSAFSKVLKIDIFDSPWLFASLNEDYSGIYLSWETDYEHESFDGFRIYRSTEKNVKGKLLVKLNKNDCVVKDSGYYEDIGSNDYNSIITWYEYEYLDTQDLVEGVTYYYTIEAYDGKRTSYSDTGSAEYKTAEYVLKVGETVSVFGDEDPAYVQMMLEDMAKEGMTITFTSEDESIFTVDENYNITGVSEGTANIVETVVYSYGTMSSTMTVKVPVKVLPADTTNDTTEDNPTDTNGDTVVDNPTDTTTE